MKHAKGKSSVTPYGTTTRSTTSSTREHHEHQRRDPLSGFALGRRKEKRVKECRSAISYEGSLATWWCWCWCWWFVIPHEG